jgi:hypothetical protein
VNISLLVSGDTRLETYSLESGANFVDIFAAEIYTNILNFIIIFIFIINADYKKVNKVFYVWVFLFYILLISYAIANITGFNYRIYYLFTSLIGFFYTIPFYSGKLDGHKFDNYVFMIVFAILMRVMLFIKTTIVTQGINPEFIFWDGNPIYTPISEYFVFIYKLFF